MPGRVRGTACVRETVMRKGVPHDAVVDGVKTAKTPGSPGQMSLRTKGLLDGDDTAGPEHLGGAAMGNTEIHCAGGRVC